MERLKPVLFPLALVTVVVTVSCKNFFAPWLFGRTLSLYLFLNFLFQRPPLWHAPKLLLLLGELLALRSGQITQQWLVLSKLDIAMERPDDTVRVINSKTSNIGHRLDLQRAFLALRISHLDVELLRS